MMTTVAGGMQRSRRDVEAIVPSPCPARHCWVADPADGHGHKRPGLLVEWRQSRTGWEGLVVYAADLRPESYALVQEWMPAALLTPR